MNEAQRQALLEQLRPVQLPDVSAWPAPGWWLVMACLLLLTFLLYRRYQRYRATRWLREARDELRRIRRQVQHQPVRTMLADCSRLARRVLLASHGREAVASLHGEAWLQALDQVCQRPLFAGGVGRLLESGPYQRTSQLSQDDLESLFDAIEELIGAAGRYTVRKPRS
ncbi:MAG: DUF4381 domain-containing protein [Granulosicoccus sp.]|nr:DUF4381 domain-containing protein [Granulosicoccus sp.]